MKRNTDPTANIIEEENKSGTELQNKYTYKPNDNVIETKQDMPKY